MMDQVPTSEIEKPSLKVVDDFSPLIKIFDETATEREESIINHYKGLGRIGFGKVPLEEYIKNIQDHFLEKPPQYLEDEKIFLEKIRTENLKILMEKSFEKVATFFPFTIDNPTAVFLLNGEKTDAQIISDDTFGINLNNLFSSYYKKEIRELDYEGVLKEIRSASAHELTHCFCRKMDWDKDANWILESLFEEGLATTMQEVHYPWHKEYLSEYDFWRNVIEESLNTKDPQDYLEILSKISKNETRNLYYPKSTELINKIISEKRAIKDEEFNHLITQSLIKKNGPLYHVGFKLWSDIYEKEGIEGVKGRIVKGPKSFEEFFK